MPFAKGAKATPSYFRALPGALSVPMSVEHLNFLRKALEADHWVVVKESPGNDYSISGYWYLTRPNGDAPFHLAFNGLDDLLRLT